METKYGKIEPAKSWASQVHGIVSWITYEDGRSSPLYSNETIDENGKITRIESLTDENGLPPIDKAKVKKMEDDIFDKWL